MASEVKPQGKLDDTRIMSRIENNAECTAIHTSIRIAAPGAIEDIEHVRPELDSDSFCNPRVLHNPKILVAVARTTSAWQETGSVAKAKCKGIYGRKRWRRKCSGVEVLRPVVHVQTMRGYRLRNSWDDIRTQPKKGKETG